jgi:hypothetical protein
MRFIHGSEKTVTEELCYVPLDFSIQTEHGMPNSLNALQVKQHREMRTCSMASLYSLN